MRVLLQILLFHLTCFTSSATFSATKFIAPSIPSFLIKTDADSRFEKAKIGLEIPKAFGIARSSIEEQQKQTTTFHQNTFSISSYLEGGNSSALDFQKTVSTNEFKVAQFSKKEHVDSEDWATAIDILGGMTTIAAGAGDLATAAQRLSPLKQFSLNIGKSILQHHSQNKTCF